MSVVEHTELAQRRELRTELPGPKSRALSERRAAVVASGVASTMPVYVARAGGGVIEDVDGNTLIDLGSGIAVTSVGNSDARVVAGVQEQVADFTHTCFMISPYEEYVAVAEKLAELTPGDHAKKSALFNSGAEAVENAIKVARYATGRTAVVAVDHAYHGRTNLTMALTAKAMPYKLGFGPFASDIYRVPTSYPFRDPDGMTGEQAAQRAIAAAEKTIGADQIAAVIIEPIQGEGGFIVPAPGFLSAMANWCTANGIVFIADEVQSGFARTGSWFASDHEGVVPDLVTTAKGIAGGLPLAAVTGRAELMDAVHAGGLGGTYGGNPVACAAALGAIETMAADGLLERATHIEDLVKARLRTLAETTPEIGDIRGRGAMLAIEIVKPGTKEPDAARTAAVAKKCHEQGVVILTCGTYGNVIRLLPPLVISDELLGEGLDVLTEAFAS
ncbi:4-aminobutyrate--2-oxoglutarate transaminase [Allobranchiibius huperziae]|uniref:4-aminobutyrate aminotransferase n=1 Tax=Allobranchiibius huperziae TaxID=1874116 RepID=A0A853DAC0_9MICO|nr:4-aminobutyrate--2-oxoglutarate transaminase [Allobranchiibius huperziae]NYJ73898.1 4-aminobutyrate aminotransferase/(S)-3-amino-2-methylpropionate transaminase [Allobranchiibius huperziae]